MAKNIDLKIRHRNDLAQYFLDKNLKKCYTISILVVEILSPRKVIYLPWKTPENRNRLEI